jgi:tetratricopeptide (TPR) repeat protein
MSGAYDQAVNAYHRSIQLDERYGRPYSNLALAYAQQGNYRAAVDLYRRSLELLTSDKEKAISWNRLGNVLRYLKEYQEALVAYQRADELDPQSSEDREGSNQLLYSSTDTFILVEEFVKSQPDFLQNETEAENVLTASDPAEDEDDIPAASFDAGSWVSAESISSDYLEDLSTASMSEPMVTWSEADPEEQNNLFAAVEQEEEPYFPDSGDDEMVGWPAMPETGLFEDELELITPEGFAESEGDITDLELTQAPMRRLDIEPEPFAAPTRKLDFAAAEYMQPIAQQTDVDVQELPATKTFVVAEERDSRLNIFREFEESAEARQPAPDDDPQLQQIRVEIEKVKRAVQVNPRNAYAWNTLGSLYKSAKLYKEAILAYQKAISADGSKASYHYNLGLMFGAEGLEEEAIMSFQKVIEMDPNHSLAHATLGGFYKKIGLEELAQQHIGKAMKNIYSSESEYNRACLEAICGNFDRAIELLRVALENRQTYVDWVMHDPDLDSIRDNPRFQQLISDFMR